MGKTVEELGARVFVEGMKQFDEDMKKASKSLDQQEGAFKDAGKAADQFSDSIEEVGQEVSEATTKQHALVRAEAELQRATKELSRAQRELAENTDPSKQKQLEDAVLRAKDGVAKASEATKHASTATETFGDKIKNFGAQVKASFSTIAVAAAAVMGAIMTAKKVFDWGKEGAEILATQDKFDRLAKSIGSTSTAISIKLRGSMRGMMTDADIARSATDIISLGLADTEDDVVRLARLVGKLGWDMQTVILTFANNSKMRLDSLGLSVEDVERRMAALVEQGYSTDKAFDLAVMEAGEDKLKLVGDAADTGAGAFARLETKVKNTTDAMKINIAEVLIPLLGTMEEIPIVTYEAGEAYEDYLERVKEAALAQGYLVRETEDGLKILQQADFIAEDVTDQFIIMTKAETDAVNARKASIEALKDANWATRNWYGTLAEAEGQQRATIQAQRDHTEAVEQENEVLRQLRGVTVEATMAQLEQARAANELAAAEAELAQAEANVRWQVRENINALIGQRDQFVLTTDQVITHGEELGKFFIKELEAEAKTDDFTTALFEAAQQAGAGATELALLALATGDYTEAEIEAALKTAAMQQAIQNMAKEIAEGKLGVPEALEQLDRLKERLEGIPTEKIVKVSVITNAPDVLAGKLGIPAEQFGGEVVGGRPIMVGERGPELFIPATAGRIAPNTNITDARSWHLTTQSINRPGTLSMEFFEMEMASR